ASAIAVTSGKRPVASFPARDVIQTSPSSTPTRARMPSHFISKAQFPSSGGSAFDGTASMGRRSRGTAARGTAVMRRGYRPAGAALPYEIRRSDRSKSGDTHERGEQEHRAPDSPWRRLDTGRQRLWRREL